MSNRLLARAWLGLARRAIPAAACILSGISWNCAAADTPPEREMARGEMLYSTHCIACHNAQIHWREKTLVTDWGSLQFQVERWQGTSGLGWSDKDIEEVARYLDTRYYHFNAQAKPLDEGRR